MEQLFGIFDSFIHEDWFTAALGAAIILAITFVVSRITVSFMRRLLNRTTLLPSSSIFINLVRVIVWVIGVGCVLSICFNVNVNAMITGLGVVGIAISLGFQDTLSNLLGGLQVSLSRSVEPGDNIRNSLMTSTAVAKLSPITDVSINLVVTTNSERLTAAAHHIEDAAEKAVARVSKIKKKPQVSFSAITDYGFQGSLSFTIADASKVGPAKDAAIQRRKNKMPRPRQRMNPPHKVGARIWDPGFRINGHESPFHQLLKLPQFNTSVHRSVWREQDLS